MTSDTDITYAYDAENRLVSVSGVGENAAFSYDPLGRLLKTTINGNTRWYLNSGDNLLAEYVGGAVTERYVHAANMGTPVAMYAGATMSESSLAYLHTNHQGSVIAYSNATGSIYQVNSYDEYGMTAESNLGRFGYTGQLYFGDLWLYHYRARFYSPGLGRFLQTDPVGYEDQMNLYAYVHNDPLNFTDPNGEFAHIVGAGVLGFIAGAAVNAGVQYIANGSIDLPDAFAAGAAAGLTSAAIAANPALAASPGAIAALGSVMSVGGSVAADKMNGQDVNVGKAVVAGVAGGLGAVGGATIGNAVENALGATATSIAGELSGAALGEAAGASINAAAPAVAEMVGEAANAVSDAANRASESVSECVSNNGQGCVY